MAERIAIILGHPDPRGGHFGHALAEAYRRGAEQAGLEVRLIPVAKLDFPLLRSSDEFEHGEVPESVRQAQETLAWAQHLLLIYPLWLGTMPALVKAFLEQVLRPGFAIDKDESGRRWTRRLSGRSARIVVTMGMPALVYRWYFRAHSLKSLERNILGFCGIGPIKETLIGGIEAITAAKRQRWLQAMHRLGRSGR